MDLSPEEMKWLQNSYEKNYDGINGSACFLSLYSDSMRQDPVCMLQLGMAIMMDKPIMLLVKKGHIVPETLKKIARYIEFYENMDDMQEATKKMLLSFLPPPTC